MANNEEGEETAPRGNEWEVVSLTQSAYAAAPGPKQVDPSDGDSTSAKYVGETSQAMFMSGHFVFPPSQHENLPLEPDVNEISNEQGGEDASPELVADEGEFEEDAALQGLNLLDKEQSFFGTTERSYQCEEPIGLSATAEETNVLAESVEPFHQGVDSGISNLPKDKDEEAYDPANLPCQAWWKRGAASLVTQAKDANAFWSIFIAAAVMGLVIIGQKWQQERWQVLQLKWQVGIHDERIGKVFGPLSRLKDVIVGGDRRGAFLRGSTPAQR